MAGKPKREKGAVGGNVKELLESLRILWMAALALSRQVKAAFRDGVLTRDEALGVLRSGADLLDDMADSIE